MRQGLNPYTIVISQSPTDFLILEGPSGKGEYQLRATSDTIPFGIGGVIYYTAWQAENQEGSQNLRLRYQDVDVSGGKWVAVPEENGDWSIWWYEKLPHNEDDLPGAVSINVELAPVSDQYSDRA